LLRIRLSPHQRILCAGHDRDIGASNEFEHAQGMRHFLMQPLIARHDRNSQHFSPWRLDQEQHRLLISSRRPGCILIDNDFPFLLRPAGKAEN